MFVQIPDTGRTMPLNTKHLSITPAMCSPEERQQQQQQQQQEEVSDLQLGFVFGNTSVVKPQTPHILPEEAEPQELPGYYSETLSLRRTQLRNVGESILKNSSLKYLYLEGNQISAIPDSMFIRLPNLLWLDLRNNQIASLPVQIGLHRSLKTLLLEGNPISELPLELGNVITLNGLNLRNCPITFPPRDVVDQGLQSILQYLRSAMAQRPVSRRKSPPELPVVEKLQLSELTEEQDESVDEDKLQKFRELKDKMNLLDKAELDSTAQRDRKSRLPVIRRKKATTKAGVIPELPLFDTRHRRRPEEKRPAAMKELKEKQDVLEQRRRSQEALRRITREQKKVQKKHPEQRKQEEADSGSCQSQTACMSITEWEERRSTRAMERQIRTRVEKIQEGRRNPRGTPAEQMVATEEDVDELRKLQAQLLERPRNQGRDLGKCFTIVTGDTWTSFIDE